MDLFTHAVIGAAAAAAIAPRRSLRSAALTGAIAALVPDADALIQSASDPLLNLQYHRHFTHALVAMPIGALAPAALLWLLLRKRERFPALYAYALVGYALAPLVDACTSYGTHLFWPFTERPVAAAIISIVDPLFTLAVVVPLVFALRRRSPVAARWGLGLAAAVLALALAQHLRALDEARALAAARGQAPERLFVKPTFGNLWLWRSIYVVDGRIHVDAIRVLWPGSNRIYAGEAALLFSLERDLDVAQDSTLARDIRRFVAFADGLPVRHRERSDFIGDARFSMLPTSLVPLWGIVIDASRPAQHARFETDRRLTPESRRRFLAMLLGRDAE